MSVRGSTISEQDFKNLELKGWLYTFLSGKEKDHSKAKELRVT